MSPKDIVTTELIKRSLTVVGIVANSRTLEDLPQSEFGKRRLLALRHALDFIEEEWLVRLLCGQVAYVHERFLAHRSVGATAKVDTALEDELRMDQRVIGRLAVANRNMLRGLHSYAADHTELSDAEISELMVYLYTALRLKSSAPEDEKKRVVRNRLAQDSVTEFLRTREVTRGLLYGEKAFTGETYYKLESRKMNRSEQVVGERLLHELTIELFGKYCIICRKRFARSGTAKRCPECRASNKLAGDDRFCFECGEPFSRQGAQQDVWKKTFCCPSHG